MALRTAGIEPVRPLFRLPDPAGNTDVFVLQSVAAHGWWHIDCDVVADDWKDELRGSRSGSPTTRSTTWSTGRGADSAYVLFHSWPDPTPEAIAIVVDHAHAEGDARVALTDVPPRME